MSVRSLAALAAMALSGCLMIAETAVDVAGIAGPVPIAAGAGRTICFETPGEAPECHTTATVRAAHGGADWLRIEGSDEEPPLDFLFFEDGGRSWAFLRLDDGSTDAVPLTLLRARTDQGRAVLELPVCGTTGDGIELGDAARAAGAQVEMGACLFGSMADLMAFARTLPDDAPGGRITIRP